MVKVLDCMFRLLSDDWIVCCLPGSSPEISNTKGLSVGLIWPLPESRIFFPIISPYLAVLSGMIVSVAWVAHLSRSGIDGWN